jgi:hypothetical protein
MDREQDDEHGNVEPGQRECIQSTSPVNPPNDPHAAVIVLQRETISSSTVARMPMSYAILRTSPPTIVPPLEYNLGLRLVQLFDLDQFGQSTVLRVERHGHRLRKRHGLIVSSLGR